MISLGSTLTIVAAISGLLARDVQGLAYKKAGPNATSSSQSAWPHLIPLTRHSVPVIRLNRAVSYKTSYSGSIAVGTPAQEFRVVFDTGSGNIVLPSADCPNETCIVHKQYDISKSQTGVAINADGSTVPADQLRDQLTIGYGTGKITGEFVRDRLCPGGGSGTCLEMSVVVAVEMTSQPFKAFNFDGIVGLSLDALAISSKFSFFKSLAASSPHISPQFGVFLTDDNDGQGSEIAFGGYNSDRLLTPLKWAPVEMQDLGYWQVSIKEVRVDGKALEICKDGTCRGIVDTGTSHLGVPVSGLREFMGKLAIDIRKPPDDCSSMHFSTLEFELEGELKLSLNPENLRGTGSCAPRLTPVNVPSPLGPKLFILGEPVLHRYYTVYDWGKKQVGFGVSSAEINKKLSQEGDEMIFMQVTLRVKFRARINL